MPRGPQIETSVGKDRLIFTYAASVGSVGKDRQILTRFIGYRRVNSDMQHL